jgi:hypothetical protein
VGELNERGPGVLSREELVAGARRAGAVVGELDAVLDQSRAGAVDAWAGRSRRDKPGLLAVDRWWRSAGASWWHASAAGRGCRTRVELGRGGAMRARRWAHAVE